MQSQPSPSIPDSRPVRVAFEAYRSSLAGSLEAARRHDQFRQRLHAIESAMALIRLLFGLEDRSPPVIDVLSGALAEIEEAQDWPAGYLRWALLNLVSDPAPKRQLELARRVERVLTSRGIDVGELSSPPPPPVGERPLATGGLRGVP